MKILSGDIGGTNSRFAVYEASADGRLERIAAEKLRSADYASLAEAAEHFLGSHSIACDRAAFGVPGPVFEGRCRTTNLPWTVDVATLRERLDIPHVALMNDLEAKALGLETLEDHEIHVLHPGSPRAGNAALIAAGTGLGQAGLFWDGERHVPFATEGGHAGFAPRDDLEIALLRHCEQSGIEYVSAETLITGAGLVRLHDFVLHHRGRAARPEFDDTSPREHAALVSRLGRAGSCLSCREALEIFVRLYGAEAGNLALKTMAVAGVWIGGGIAPKLLDLLTEGDAFREAFCAKGPMRPVLEDMPLRVVLAGDVALRGACRMASGAD